MRLLDLCLPNDMISPCTNFLCLQYHSVNENSHPYVCSHTTMATTNYTQQSQLRPPTKGFHCSESIEKKGIIPSIIFRCNLPPPNDNKTLQFNCREPSCGALEGEETAATLTDEDYAVDPNFFDSGYSMAGSTGFKVWTGSRLMIETLTWPQCEIDPERLVGIRRRLLGGAARVVELGAGVGVVGTYLAAVGATVLLTDLATLVENAIDSNLLQNEGIATDGDDYDTNNNNPPPSWLESSSNCRRIGKGWAATTPLDWTCPIDEQLTKEQSESIDLVIASDVVFLVSMLTSLLDTVESIFKSSSHNNPSFILSFQRRDAKDGEESSSFTTVNRIISSVKKRGWTIDCLAWRPVTVRKEECNGDVKEEQSEVFVFDINPCWVA